MNDNELLAEFARTGNETAFAELVSRHVNLVYSAAFRSTQNRGHAEEIAQAVFVILARKAGSLGKNVVLSGWLYQTARFTSANFMKGELRRQRREQEAFMQSTLNEPVTGNWEQLAPWLEEAMGHLGETDRNAIVLRYFENKSGAEVATSLRINEAAAHKRISRALDKLKSHFLKRGVASTTTAIATLLCANSIQAAPATLANSITTVAAAKGAALSAATLTLAKETIKLMTWTKLKLAGGLSAVVLLTLGTITAAISQTSGDDKWTPQEIARKSQEAYDALSSYHSTGEVITRGGDSIITTTFDIRLQRPNLYRVDWSQTASTHTLAGAIWSDGVENFYMAKPILRAGEQAVFNNVSQGGGVGGGGTERNTPLSMNGEPQKMKDMQTTFGSAIGISSAAGTLIPSTFFKQNWSPLAVLASPRAKVKKEGSEKIGTVDCFLISCTFEPVDMGNGKGKTPRTSSRLWIGKQDFLIHQSESTTEGGSGRPAPSDAFLIRTLEQQKKAATPEAIKALRTQIENAAKNYQGRKFIATQTHKKITVNQPFTKADFVK